MYEGDLYAEKNPTWHEEDAPWKAGHIERMIRETRYRPIKYARSVRHRRYPFDAGEGFSVGCVSAMRSLPRRSIGPSRRNAAYEILSQGYAGRERSAFRFVLAIDVIEHVEDYISFIKKLREFATYKIFHIRWTCPRSRCSGVAHHGASAQRRSPALFFKQTALATLEDCGYTIVDHRYTASVWNCPISSVAASCESPGE